MTEQLEHGQRILDAQPFSKLVGVEIDSFEPGRIALRLPLRPDHMQHLGIVHGGVTATLADMAIAFAGGSRLGNVVTLEFKLNLIRPGRGEAMLARGEVLSLGRRQAVCRAEIYSVEDGEEKLCAAAQGTMAKVEGGGPVPQIET